MVFTEEKLVTHFYPSYLRLFRHELFAVFTLENIPTIQTYCQKKGLILDMDQLIKARDYFETEEYQEGYAENIEKAKMTMLRLILPKESNEKNVKIALGLLEHYYKSSGAPKRYHLDFFKNSLSIETQKYYLRFFSANSPIKMDLLAQTLEIRELCQALDMIFPGTYDKLLATLKPYIDKNEIDSGADLFLRLLPFESLRAKEAGRPENSWYYDFLEACLKHGYTRMLPSFKNLILVEYKMKTLKRSIQDTSVADLLVDGEYTIPDKPRDQKDYEKFRTVSAETLMLMSDPSNYELRPYQNELVSNALVGKNTIICAPTGSGKTNVAVDIIMKHLKARHEDKKVARVAMFVPTVPLVDQQTFRFLAYMKSIYWIDGLSGAENVPSRCGVVLATDVVVMTPQIFINMMNSVEKNERLYISDFTMFVFDECHHCDAEHPYKILMDMVHDFRGPKPQIVGLTASLGIGKNLRNPQGCEDHLIKMCANLNAECISTVQKHEASLLQYVQPPEDEVINAHKPSDDKFANLIKTNMIRIAELMKPELKEVQQSKAVILRNDEIGIPKPESAYYQTVIGTLKSKLNSLPYAHKKHFLLQAIVHLKYYYHALVLNDLLPSKYSYQYLSESMYNHQQISRGNQYNAHFMEFYHDLCNDLKSLARDEETDQKPILRHLHAELNSQYLRNPASRTLIFVTTRAGAKLLADYLNGSDKIPALNVGRRMNLVDYVTSSNQSTSAGGISNERQKEVLAHFEQGKIKVLVATSVVEEGLDIAQCNLIIKYNNVGSERSLIQRRGRARAKDSRSILLATEEDVAKQEFQNMRSEALMHHTIKELQHESENVLKGKIKKKIDAMKLDRQIEETKKFQKQRELENRRYALKCRQCSELLCDSHRVRVLSNDKYLCCDPKIWKRCNIKDDDDPKKSGITTICGKVYCKCGQPWGTVIRYSNVFMPSLSADGFVMERTDRKDLESDPVNRKTWKQIEAECFNIGKLDDNNLKEMYHALKREAAEKYDRMELAEQKANKKELERWEEKKAGKKYKFKVTLLDD